MTEVNDKSLVNFPNKDIYLHCRALNGHPPLVLNETPDSPVRLRQELQHGGAVVLPELGQLLVRRELAAGDLERDLHAAVPDVVVVLHAARQRVPRGAVRRAVDEFGGAGLRAIKV